MMSAPAALCLKSHNVGLQSGPQPAPSPEAGGDSSPSEASVAPPR